MSQLPSSDDPGSRTGRNSLESMNRQAWTVYGRFQLDRGFRTPDPVQIHWGAPGDAGPGTGVLGAIAGKRLLDLGSGGGHYAAHLARDHRAVVDAIDVAPTQHQRALLQYADVPGVRFLLGDAIDHLDRCEPYDLVYSVHGLGYLHPHRSLPALYRGLRPGGRLVFSVLHTDLHRRPPSSRLEPRQLKVQLKGLEPQDVHLWVLTPQLWEDVLTDHDFTVEAIDVLHRHEDDPVVDQLIQARRA
ncbi:SAM-dependent methyltransferase [Streptomyces pseudovenezuelae]|uniref:SAM-dependent methyltransferase n=2 Tax=Streptomyces pseudovenezuelae TaxID=67350 RepID=A0ABT6LCT5_9ACTN|nr:SAM-dependent methyltransferase [Streptomyces pseudovenezuelae]